MQTDSLTGRHAVVTGAARGIGAEIARALAARGRRADLARAQRGRAPARRRCARGQRPRRSLWPTWPTRGAVQRAFEQARAARGPIAMLVNNAGQAESAPFLKTSVELWQRMLSVNLTGSFVCAQAALPDMLTLRLGPHRQHREHGRAEGLCLRQRLHGGQARRDRTHAFAGAGGGAEEASRSMPCAPATPTPTSCATAWRTWSARPAESADERWPSSPAVNPQRRIVQPSEVADAVRWLCGEAAASVTGQSISVSGGEVT